MVQILPLSRAYTCRLGAPTLERVDPAIFELAYFANCPACTTCADQCCSWGVDVDGANMERLLDHAEALEARTGVPRERWFEAAVVPDADFPSGRVGRTRSEDGACVFLRREGRGCHIHGYALEAGLDVYALKPMVSSLFPLSFSQGTLFASDEAEEGSLACAGEGESLYRGSRAVLEDLFGAELVGELDGLERELLR